MNCTLCGIEARDPVSIVSSRKLEKYEPAAGISHPHPEADAITTWTYHVHQERCFAKLRHLLGSHAEVQDPDCPLCEDAIAMKELAALSDKAKGLLLHRLRNPLTIIIGSVELAHLGEDPGERIEVIGAASKRIDRELTELIGGKL